MKDQSLPFRTNLIWAITGNVIYAVCQWGMLLLIAKLSTATAMGLFALGLAISSPIIMMAGLGLRSVQATDAAGEFSFSSYWKLRLSGLLLAFVAMALVCLVAGYGRTASGVVMLIGSAKCTEALSDIVFGKFQQKERMDLVARSMMIKGIASLGFFAVILTLSSSLLLAIGGWLAVWAAVLLLYDIPHVVALIKDEGPTGLSGWGRTLFGASIDLPVHAKLAKISMPLGMVVGLSALVPSIPRYIIEHRLGVEQLGFFAALAYLTTPGNVVVSAIGYAASPRLAVHFNAREAEKYRHLLIRVVILGICIGLLQFAAFGIGGGALLALLLNDQFKAGLPLLYVLLLVAILSYAFGLLGVGITAARQFKIQLYIGVGLSIMTLVLAVILVPLWGLYGAALSIAGGTVVASLAYGFILNRSLSRARLADQLKFEETPLLDRGI